MGQLIKLPDSGDYYAIQRGVASELPARVLWDEAVLAIYGCSGTAFATVALTPSELMAFATLPAG